MAEEFGISRERFVEALRAEGIPAGPGYPHPLYRNPLFQRKGIGPAYCPISCPYYGREVDYSQVLCPNAERVCREAVWLPQWALLAEEEDMADVVAAVRKVRACVGEFS